MKNFLTACAVALALATFNGIASYAIKDRYFYNVTGTHIPVSRYAKPVQPTPCTHENCASPDSYKVNRTSLPKDAVAKVLPITRVINERNAQTYHAGE